MVDRPEPLLDLDSRRRIFRHIERNPGLHLRGLQRSLGMPLGTVEYHLHQMEKTGIIVSRDDGRFKAFFAKEGLDRRDKDILYYVRQEMPRQIVLQLLMSPGLTHAELTGSLPISASTCSFHLKKLINAELVAEERIGRSKRFTVREPDRVAAVIVRYRRSFLDDLVDRFARAWLDLGHGTAAGIDGQEAPTPEPVDMEVEPSAVPPTPEEPDDASVPENEPARMDLRGTQEPPRRPSGAVARPPLRPAIPGTWSERSGKPAGRHGAAWERWRRVVPWDTRAPERGLPRRDS